MLGMPLKTVIVLLGLGAVPSLLLLALGMVVSVVVSLGLGTMAPLSL